MLEITSLYAVPMGGLMFILWLNVTKTRANQGVSIGDNNDPALLEKIRRHGNFIEWVPMVLLMMSIAELRGGNGMGLHAAGILLVVSRFAHPFGLKYDNPAHVLRIVGNSGSLLALVISVVLIVISHLS